MICRLGQSTVNTILPTTRIRDAKPPVNFIHAKKTFTAVEKCSLYCSREVPTRSLMRIGSVVAEGAGESFMNSYDPVVLATMLHVNTNSLPMHALINLCSNNIHVQRFILGYYILYIILLVPFRGAHIHSGESDPRGFGIISQPISHPLIVAL